MATMPSHRYPPFPAIKLPDRKWPNRTLTTAPTWCSVDLRDGNQALIEPMTVETKIRFFRHLAQLGFKEIEIGFPASSQVEFDFTRKLIEENLIPDDVTIQVLTQSKEDQIRRTFEAVKGAQRVIVHLYNSTSTQQRRVVFNADKKGVTEIALSGAKLIQEIAAEYPETYWTFQYSPESFTGTEPDFAVRICNAVLDVWQPTLEHQAIINLPATVELCMPNAYADLIESFCRRLIRRDCVFISLHTHNDRGTGIAATELGLLAGADRVEGTLFANGERTGNADVVVLALNLMTQGVDPQLDFSDITESKRVYEECTGLSVHPRHPYAGELAHTAFSGSHQDAIDKGFEAQAKANEDKWTEVPYLPVDPHDLGLTYQSVIRVNSQSGKGGVAHLLKRQGLELPRALLVDFSTEIKKVTAKVGTELSSEDLLRYFREEYVDLKRPIEFVRHVELPTSTPGRREVVLTLKVNGVEREITGAGNGVVDALVDAFGQNFSLEFGVLSLEERSIRSGSDATAVAYVPIRIPGRPPIWGVGMHPDTAEVQLRAVISAVNRSGLAING